MSKFIEQFYIENRTMLLKRLYHRAGSPHNAEDVLQESFCKALKYQHTFNPKFQEIGAWFNTIMNNTLKTFKRDEKSMGTFVELEEELTGTYEMSQTDGDMAERLKVYMVNKSGLHRNILHLYFNMEYKPREIKEVLDIPVKSIDTVVFRFRQEMADKFGERD